MKNINISVDEMKEELTQYYESAGFSNIYERTLKNKTEEEIINMYEEIMNDEEIDLF